MSASENWALVAFSQRYVQWVVAFSPDGERESNFGQALCAVSFAAGLAAVGCTRRRRQAGHLDFPGVGIRQITDRQYGQQKVM